MNPRQTYLSDEELNMLIAEAETEQTIAPPSDLEQRIMRKVAAQQHQKEKRDFVLYSLKITAAAAAAIFLIFTAPVSLHNTAGKEVLPQQRQESVYQKLNRATEDMQQRLQGRGIGLHKEESER